eukprot:XP_001693847.1 predicted protein [Chlamydomonas reinhardtii]
MRATVALILSIICCSALAPSALAARRSLLGSDSNSKTATTATYLYVWAGPKDASLGGKDSVFVISLADGEYGKIVSVVPTPYSTLEPHHCRISSTRTHLACAGLFSALTGTPSVLFFELSDPRTPKLVDPAKVDQPKHSAFADEFVAIADGGFLLSMMGSSTGGSPGRVAHYSKDFKLIGEYPDPAKFPDIPGFNPHGLGVSWVHKTMVTVDYVVPASTLVGNPLTMWSTVRLWNISDWTITETIDASAQGVKGPMDAVAIAETGAFYFEGGNGYIYYLDGKGPKPHVPVVAWDTYAGSANRASAGCIMHPFRNGTRLLAAPFVRDQVHAAGDMTVRLFRLNDRATKFILRQPAKSLIDFKTVAKKQGIFRPHGLAIY